MSHNDERTGAASDENVEMNRLSAEDGPLGAALRAAKREAPPVGMEGRVAARLGVPLVGASLAASVPAAKVAAVATKSATGVAMKLAALAVAGVGLGVGGAYIADSIHHFSHATVPVASLPLPSTPGSRGALGAPFDAPVSSVSSTSSPASASPTAPSVRGAVPVTALGTPRPPTDAPPVDSLTAEAALLTEARNSLAGGALGAARAALARHRSLFPSGALALERDVLDLEARAKSGDSTAATDAARLADDARYRPYQRRLRALAPPVPAP
jgi:hypothetical protein